MQTFFIFISQLYLSKAEYLPLLTYVHHELVKYYNSKKQIIYGIYACILSCISRNYRTVFGFHLTLTHCELKLINLNLSRRYRGYGLLPAESQEAQWGGGECLVFFSIHAL
jgi:hypothetical protein